MSLTIILSETKDINSGYRILTVTHFIFWDIDFYTEQFRFCTFENSNFCCYTQDKDSQGLVSMWSIRYQ